MASAFLTLPLAYLSFRLEGGIDSHANEIRTCIQTFGTLIFIAIISYLKRFLNYLTFHNTDTSIALMVMAGMATGAVTIGMYSFPTLRVSLEPVVVIILALLGIVQIQFGYKLLTLPYNLGGLLKPFCYANMITGFLLATVVFIPLSMLVSALSDLMLGTIFFNMSQLIKKQL